MTSREKDAALIVSTLVVLSIGNLFLEFDYINQVMWKALTPRMVAEFTLLGSLILVVTYRVSVNLRAGPRYMQFSWLKLIPPLRRVAENVATLPLRLITPLAIAYMVVLTYMLPAIAFIEEWMFRGQISGFWSAVLVTVIFALIHLAVGATIGGSIALTIPGGFFALVYMMGGLAFATYLHIFYDVAAIAMTMAIFIREKRAEKLDPATTAA